MVVWLSSALASPLSQTLKERYLAHQRLTYTVGETEYTALRFASAVPLSRGVAMIFVEPARQGLTLQTGQALAAQLQQWGWHTLVVPLASAEALPGHQPAAEKDAQPAASDGQSEPADWAQVVAKTTAAVFDAIADEPGYRLVITQGMVAAQVLELSAAQQLPTPDSLVVVAPFWPELERNQQVTRWIAETQAPVLDIAGGLINRWAAHTSQARRVAASTGLKLHYRQRDLPVQLSSLRSTPGQASPFASRLGREIHGWTRHLGW